VSDNIGNGVFVFESPYFGDFYEGRLRASDVLFV